MVDLPKNPIQPHVVDAMGVLRFKANAIVRDLLDFATDRGMGMNEIAASGYTNDDRQQFAQLIGYSVSGYSGLSYTDGDAVDAKTEHPMLKELCEALGWQGGTIWQVLEEVKRLKAENERLRHDLFLNITEATDANLSS